MQTSSTHTPEVDRLHVQSLAIKSFFGIAFEISTTVHAEGCNSDILPHERLLNQMRGCRNRKVACTCLALVQLAMLQNKICNLGPGIVQ